MIYVKISGYGLVTTVECKNVRKKKGLLSVDTSFLSSLLICESRQYPSSTIHQSRLKETTLYLQQIKQVVYKVFVNPLRL